RLLIVRKVMAPSSYTSPLVGEVADERSESAGGGALCAVIDTPHPPNVVSARRPSTTSPTRGKVVGGWLYCHCLSDYQLSICNRCCHASDRHSPRLGSQRLPHLRRQAHGR